MKYIDLPAGAIYVHTHPYSNGETQRYCDTPRPIEYNNEVGVKDRPVLEKMGVNRGIIIDANKIILYTPNESSEPTLIERCGY